MSYTLSRLANNTVEVTAEYDAEAVAKERAQIIKGFSRQARIPGFRPGKAPASAVQARFAEDIEKELREHLAGAMLREVFEAEEDLEPVTHPQLKDAEFVQDGSFRMTAAMEIRPRYELPEVGDVVLPEVSLEVSDADIDSEIDKVAEEHASWEPADDEPAADGMLVEADLSGVMEDSDEEPYDEKDARFVIGHDSVPEQINEALQGARVGDQRVAEKTFPSDDDNPDRAGKTVRYTIDVKGLKRKVLPEVDDELAKTIGLDSLGELKQRVVEMIERDKKLERRERWRRTVLDHLEDGIDINELPPSLVSSAVQEDLNRFAYSLAMRGVDPEKGDVDWQELSARMEPGARRRVLDMLVLEQLAEAWQIPVPEAEVDGYVAAEAQRMGVPPAEHKANLAKENKLDGIRHSARISATANEMIRRAGGEVD
jgi:trigger factor